MSAAPPHLAPPLALATASVAIRECFPSVRTEGLVHLGSGWDFDAFLTTDGWVFRFPRRAECADTLGTERRLHDLVARATLPGMCVGYITYSPTSAFLQRVE